MQQGLMVTRENQAQIKGAGLMAVLSIISACSSPEIAPVPLDMRASILTEDIKNGTIKVSVDEILNLARQQDDTSRTTRTAATKPSRFATFLRRDKNKPDHFSAPPRPNDGKTSLTGTVNEDPITAFLEREKSGQAADGGLTNAEIAKNWIETGPEDLAGLPIDGFDDDHFYDATNRKPADILFADHLKTIDARPTAFEQNASFIFEHAKRLATQLPSASQHDQTGPRSDDQAPDPMVILIRSKALNARQASNLLKHQTNDVLIEQAQRLIAKGNQTVHAATDNSLTVDINGQTLSAREMKKLIQFKNHHSGKSFILEAGLGKNGTKFEKLATAEARLAKLSKEAPAFKHAKRWIKPDLQPNTIKLSINAPQLDETPGTQP